MRLLLALLLGTVFAGEGPDPLPTAGAAVQAVAAALQGLVRGDAGPFTALPATAFTAPPALRDPVDDTNLFRRWTWLLPQAVMGLGPADRVRIDAALNRRFKLASPGSDPAIGLDFLPAPTAQLALRRWLDRAFDHGEPLAFLDLAAVAGIPASDPRPAVATALLGLGDGPSAGEGLAPPGLPLPTTARAATADHDGWSRRPGWLLALDPWGRVRWQYAVARSATVLTGASAAVVRDDDGLRTLNRLGQVRALPPMPASLHLLGVAAGALFAADGVRAWRLELRAGTVEQLLLDEAPVAAPLATGRRSLWLGATRVQLVEDGAVVARVEHGLPVGPGWALARDSSGLTVAAPDGRAWRLTDAASQLATSSGEARMRLLLALDRPADVLNLPATSATAQALALRAHLRLGPAHAATAATAMLVLASTDQERGLVWWLALAGGHAAARAQLAALPPELVVPLGLAQASLPPDAWDHRAALGRWLSRPQIPRGDQLTPSTRPAPPKPVRRSDGGWQVGPLALHLTTDPAWTTVTASSTTGEVWRRRWAAPSAYRSPGRAWSVANDQVVVVEGGGLVTASALSDGTGPQLTVAATEPNPGQVVVLSNGHGLALCWPPGINDRLTLSSATGERTWQLPARGMVLLPVPDGRVLALLGDGSARWYPADNPATVPLRQVSAVDALGCWDGDLGWEWR